MQFWSVFPNVTKIANFLRKDADVNRTQGVCRVWDMRDPSSVKSLKMARPE